MMQGHGGGPAFFNFTKRNHICSLSIIGSRWALEFRQLPTLESHRLPPLLRGPHIEPLRASVSGIWGHILMFEAKDRRDYIPCARPLQYTKLVTRGWLNLLVNSIRNSRMIRPFVLT